MIIFTPWTQSQSNYLVAKQQEQHVAHIPQMVAPGPETMTCSHFLEYKYIYDISPEISRDFIYIIVNKILNSLFFILANLK